MSLPLMTSALELLSEPYSLLASELESVLSNPEDLYSNVHLNDMLSVIINKLDAIKFSYDLDADQLSELSACTATTYQTIIDAFKVEFPSTADAIESEFPESSMPFLAEIIYKYLYIGRRQLLMNYLISTTIGKRVQLAKGFRTPDFKKDITYQAIRSEFPIKNPDYYVLLMNYNQLSLDILTDEGLDIMDIFNSTDLTEDEHDALTSLFNNNGVEAYQEITKSLVASFSFQEFVSSFRFSLATEIKAVS